MKLAGCVLRHKQRKILLLYRNKKGRVQWEPCAYSQWEATLANPDDMPAICEPQTFDDLRYWDATELEGRADLSVNLSNLLKSGVLA